MTKPRIHKDAFHAQFHNHERHVDDGNHPTTEWWEHYEHKPGVKKKAMEGKADLDYSRKKKPSIVHKAMERAK